METLKYNHNKHSNNHNQRNGVKQRFDDPELEAETRYAKENGFAVPRSLPSESVKKITEAFSNGTGSIDKVFPPKVLKTDKAARKARSRGVSGCSTKKDGGRFEYGLDCLDMAYDNKIATDESSSDSEAEYDEYTDYVFKYSDNEIRSIVQDYLFNGSKDDALNSLEKFRITSDATFRMLKDLIQLSLEAADGGGVELGAQLLVEIYNQEWTNPIVLANVIEEVVNSLKELAVDSPKIVEATSIFLAKMVDYHIVTADIIKLLANKKQLATQKANRPEDKVALQCYEDALTFADNRTLLHGKCVPAGGHQSLEVLSAQFKMILKEYLLSNDKEQVCERVKELKVPHYGHDFVYQAGIFALEKMHDNVMLRLSELIKVMYENGIISESCLQKGYEKLYKSLSDLYYDLPAAYCLARRWVDKCVMAKFLSDDLAKKCPVRARSRTVSEGPDGKLICMDEDEFGEKVSGNGYENGYEKNYGTAKA